MRISYLLNEYANICYEIGVYNFKINNMKNTTAENQEEWDKEIEELRQKRGMLAGQQRAYEKLFEYYEDYEYKGDN